MYLFIGFLGIAIIGAILHFVYDWTNHNKLLAFFLPVNESTWEHIKIGLLPAFIWGMGGIIVYHDIESYPFALFILLLSIIILIPLMYYSYRAFTKKSILFVDISIYFVSVAVGILFCWLILNTKNLPEWLNLISISGTLLIALAFGFFTFFPPKIFLFEDPITHKYGRAGHFDDKNYGNNYTYKDKK